MKFGPTTAISQVRFRVMGAVAGGPMGEDCDTALILAL
jgi:hypothetical protein